MEYLTAFEYTLGVTSPVFVIVFLGYLLKKRGQINSEFVNVASGLVFNICLPILIFIAMLQNQVDLSLQIPLALYCLFAAAFCFILFWWGSAYHVAPADRGVVVQGAFRSNLGIIGLALCGKAFGQEGLVVGAVILAVVVPIFNVLSVYALNRSLATKQSFSLLKTVKDVIKNPLIIAILLGVAFTQAGIGLPKVMYDAGAYLAAMTLPLALICIGGTLSLRELTFNSRLSSMAVFAKLIVVPLIAVLPAYYLGFSSIELGCILLMFASPTATASFVMVRSLGGNYALASNIIVLSTLLSVISISALLYGAKLMYWI